MVHQNTGTLHTLEWDIILWW